MWNKLYWVPKKLIDPKQTEDAITIWDTGSCWHDASHLLDWWGYVKWKGLDCRVTEFIGRTKHVAKDIKQQITAATKANKAYNIQLDESIHIVKNAQCTVYVI